MPTDTRVLEFADFRIDAGERVLYRGNTPVRLAPKVFDTLLALVSRQGRVVSKDLLMEEIWGNTFVEENNLTQHIFTLRRTLGESKRGTKFIETVPRLGYRFLPEVKVVGEAEVPARLADDVLVKVSPTFADVNGSGSESHSDNTSGAPATRRRKPVGRAILVLGFVIAALAASLGFALRSSWQSAGFKNASLLRLTETGNVWGASISPDGKSLAYVVREGTTYSLRLKNIQTESEIVVLPPADVRLGHPRFSPDGNFIYLARDNEVVRIPVFGGATRSIASDLWSNFSVSPDGREISFPRSNAPGGTSSIVIANTDGSGERVVATKSNPDFYLGWGPAPVFSPDGEHLTAIKGRHGSNEVRIVEIDSRTGDELDLEMDAVWEGIEYVDWRSPRELLVAGKKKGEDTTQIWSVKSPGGSVERVTNDFNNYLSFSLSADKTEIVAIQESENLHLWLFDAETGAAQQITSGVSRGEGRYGLAFAPDGQIVFTERDKNNYDIYTVNSDGSELHQLTKSAGRNLDPVVSPDNQFIAFISDRTGSLRLWLMNRDGSGSRQLTAASDEKEFSESAPYFSADGQWIYYVSQGAGENSIRKISVDGGQSQSVGSDPTAEKPVPSPDGKFIAHSFYNNGAASPWQIAVDSLENEGPSKRIFDFPAFRSRVRWMLDSDSVVSVDDRTGGYNLWLTNLATGERKPVTNFKTDKIYRFDVSPDRRSYVLARGDYFYDAVLIGR